MMSLSYLIVVAMAMEAVTVMMSRVLGAEQQPPPVCPRGCFCNVPGRVVNCARRGMQGLLAIPAEIPSDAVDVSFNFNQFLVPVLRRSNFSANYVNVEKLYISDCGLETVQQDAFRDLVALKWLDLSSNRLRDIQMNTFASLSLQHLFLNGNRQLRLSPESFGGGLRVTGLYLHDCSLSFLAPEVLAPLNASLRNLWLNDNALERLSRRHLPLFSSLTHLRLAANPFHCNCETAWLKELLDSRKDLVFGSATPTCSSPARLKGSGFESLSPGDFSCLAPVFSNIDTQFDHTRGRLRCAASGDPLPTLYWVRPTGEVRRYAPLLLPTEPASNTNEAVLTMDHKEPDSLSGMYICIATNDGGNVTLTVNVSWPRTSGAAGLSYKVVQHENRNQSPLATTKTVPLRLTVPPRNGDDADSDVIAPSSNSSRSSGVSTVHKSNSSLARGSQEGVGGRGFMERTYSLTEMVISVVSVHVGTVLLVLALIACYQRRHRRHFPTSTSTSSVFRYSGARDKRPMTFKDGRSPELSCNAFGQRFLDYPTSAASGDSCSLR